MDFAEIEWKSKKSRFWGVAGHYAQLVEPFFFYRIVKQGQEINESSMVARND